MYGITDTHPTSWKWHEPFRDEKLFTTNTNTLRQVIKELWEPLKNSPTLPARIAANTMNVHPLFWRALVAPPSPFPYFRE